MMFLHLSTAVLLFSLSISISVESVKGFLTPNPSIRQFFDQPNATSRRRRDAPLSMSSNGNDLTGKIVAQRYIYRMSSTKSSTTTPYTIEERQYYKVAEDRSLDSFGERCFIFRGGENANDGIEPPEESVKKNGMPRIYTKLGPALHCIKDLKEDEDDMDGLGGTVWESSYAMALYCMAHPDIIKGKGLEVGCGVGVGGILSIIGAGLASGSTEEVASNAYQSIEDIANTPVQSENDDEQLVAPVPRHLSKIIMTDSHQNILKVCMDNLQSSAFPVSKAEISMLDWKGRVPNEMKDAFDFIIGCDCAYYFPLVNPLARTVAYTLKSSPYDRSDNQQFVRGNFLHIGPAHRESISDLKTKLSRGYRMETRMKEIVLERVDLAPLILDSLDVEAEQMKEEIEVEGGYVEYQNIENSRFTALSGHHNEDYDGFNGDYFFPSENGKEGSYRDNGSELDFGTETA